MHEHLYIIIPAKDEEKRIGKVIYKTQALGYYNIIVVNDGSKDNTAAIAEAYGVTVLTHPINLGPGAATQTGIEYALEAGAKYIVTMDADEQHSPSDINVLCSTIENEQVDVVLGSRFLNKNNTIPFIRIIYNKIGNLISFMLTGIYVSDSQSGMKAFNADFASKTKLKFNGFEFCIEIIRNIKTNNATFTEIPIQVMYSEETLSKGQSFFSGFQMVARLIRFFI